MSSRTLLISGFIASVAVAGAAFFYHQQSNRPRVLFVDSYHAGYAWSDGITEGVQQVLGNEDVDLRIHRMDTNRNTDEAFRIQAGIQVRDLIESYNPDIVIATDDNAQKYAIVPFYRDTDLPIVFAGVNWDASVYGYPTDNVTGMIEVQAARETVALLSRLSDGDRIGVLTGDTDTYREKESKNYRDVLGLTFDEERLVTNFEDWKRAFIEIQRNVDIVYLYNNAGIEGWDQEAAIRFAMDNTRVPTGSTSPWMAPYVLVTFTKDANEQGEYAASTAMRILGGTSPGEIPLVTNQRGEVLVNSELAHRLNIEIPASLLDAASNDRLF